MKDYGIQGSNGSMFDKLIYIQNDNTQNYSFFLILIKRFHTELNESTNQNLLKSLKLLCQRIRKHIIQLGGLA